MQITAKEPQTLNVDEAENLDAETIPNNAGDAEYLTNSDEAGHSEIPAQDESVPDESEETHSYEIGDTVYLDNKPFIIEKKDDLGVQLHDPSQRYPIFRAERIQRFERLLAEDERNAHFFLMLQFRMNLLKKSGFTALSLT